MARRNRARYARRRDRVLSIDAAAFIMRSFMRLSNGRNVIGLSALRSPGDRVAARLSWGVCVLRAICLGLVALLAGCDGDSNGNAPAPAAVLSDLVVMDVAAGLNPEFLGEIARYSVRLEAQSAALTVSPSAADGLLIEVNGALVSSGTDVFLDGVAAGESVDIVVTNTDGGRQDYEIILLPFDFPDIEVTLLEEGASDGLIYLTLRAPSSNYVTMVDNQGVPVFFRAEAARTFDFKVYPTGERSYAVQTDMQNQWGRTIAENVVLDADFVETDRVMTVGLTDTDFHEYLRLDNGNQIVMAYDGRLRDLTAFGGEAEQLVEDSVVQELDAQGNLLFEWNSWGKVLYEDELRGDPVEYAHVNSVFIDADENFLISARGTSQVLKADRQTGDVIWKLGGKSNEFMFIDDPYGNLCGQHTASRLDNGHLMIFDNGQYCWPEVPERGELTRVVEYAIDETQKTVTLVWSYSQDGVYSTAAGSAQRLDNGHTMIGWGRGPGVLATEVDADGNRVFEMIAREGEEIVWSYRARRFPE